MPRKSASKPTPSPAEVMKATLVEIIDTTSAAVEVLPSLTEPGPNPWAHPAVGTLMDLLDQESPAGGLLFNLLWDYRKFEGAITPKMVGAAVEEFAGSFKCDILGARATFQMYSDYVFSKADPLEELEKVG